MSASRPPRIRIDLRKHGSAVGRYSLVAIVVGGVVLLAWFVGRDEPTPRWITDGLVPALGWIYIALAAVALVGWWRRRSQERGEEE